jgi:hypothetical protein
VVDLQYHQDERIQKAAKYLLSSWDIKAQPAGEPPFKKMRPNPEEDMLIFDQPPKKSVSWAPEEDLVQIRVFRKADAIAVRPNLSLLNALG